MIKRNQKPAINSQYRLTIPKPENQQLSNGISLFSVKGEDVGIIRLDLIWKGGRVTEVIPGLARSSMMSLNDGTDTHSSQELSELFDFYGSSVGHRSSMEHLHSSISLLKRHVNEVIPPFLSSIFDRVADEKLMRQRQTRFAERLSNELQKNSVVAYRELTEQLYGIDHLYGYSTQPENYTDITLGQVKQYLERHISTEGCTAILAGDFTKEEQQSIIALLETIEVGSNSYVAPNYETPNREPRGKIYMEGPQPNQVTIRMGRRLFDREHQDVDHLRFANIILGGYFGSRLMTNIREEKGYCYHIDSSMDLLEYDGYMTIAADVNGTFTNECLTEIESEMHKLMKELVPDAELERVKQYIRGQFLMDSDGVFAASNLIRRFLCDGKDESEFTKKIEVLDKITAEDIRSVAKKYFDPVAYTTIIVGDKSA